MSHAISPTAGVKISEKNVDAVMKHHFADGPPDHLPFGLHVLIPYSDYDIRSFMSGGMIRLSPCEQAWAALKACARDANAGDDERMRRWRRCFLSCEISLVHDSQTRTGIHAFQLRENPLIDAEHVTFSSLQRVQMVARERRALSDSSGSPTTKQLVVCYHCASVHTSF